MPHVLIYTDGGAIGNPGPGGYGCVLLNKSHRRELFGGFRLTTNNRMEIMAAVAALRALKTQSVVTLYSGSKHVVEWMTTGLVGKWKTNEWRRGRKGRVLNVDLWQELLRLCSQHDVTFAWLGGHAGHPENERCEQLSQQAARRKDLPPDTSYEMEHTQSGQSSSDQA